MHNIPDPDLADPWRRLVSAGDNRMDHLPLHYLRLARDTFPALERSTPSKGSSSPSTPTILALSALLLHVQT